LLGLRRVGDLAALPPGAVQAQLGPPGLRAWRVANGQDDEPLVPYRPRASVRATLALDDPIASVDAVLAALERLLVRAYADPALANRAARRARLSALLADGGSWELRVAFKMPAASPAAARSLLRAKLLLPGALPAAAVAELTLELEELGGEAARQPGLFATPARQLGQIADAARQLGARYGHVPLYRVVEVEPWSRIPERRWALMPSTP